MAENYVLLERTELNADAASVTFANIPQTGYTDLKIVLSVRSLSNSNTTSIAIDMLINGVSTNRTAKRIFGVGSSAGSDSPSGARLGSAISTNTATASTFSNLDIYFPNYTSSNNKSFSVDSVTENNSTSLWEIDLTAGLWSSSAAITTLTFSNSDSSSFAANSTFSLYGIAALGTTPAIAPKASGGNIIDFDGTYWIHTFLTSGTFTPQVGLTCDYLVVAGGGGGGSTSDNSLRGAGGGGAGGYLTANDFFVTSGNNLAVTVGAGGAGGASNTQANGTQGGTSTFFSVSAEGGGFGSRGQSDANRPGGSGGSGGGGGNTSDGFTAIGGARTLGQGNVGGNGGVSNSGGAGGSGGGAGGAGTNGGTGSGAGTVTGGVGSTSSITGSSITYAAGGRGGGYNATPVAGPNGTANLGEGGGGRSGGSATAAGGNGGSGIVIIRYPAA